MLPIIVVVMVGSSPLFDAHLIQEIMYSIKVLHKHSHNKQQMGCQPIAKPRFHKHQNRGTTIILHATNHLHHSQFSQFDKVKEASNQNVKCCHMSPHLGERINVKWGGHACHYIRLHCQLE
jgi:hypothetical protein